VHGKTCSSVQNVCGNHRLPVTRINKGERQIDSFYQLKIKIKHYGKEDRKKLVIPSGYLIL
jgi:hypothetical protein